MGHIDWFTRCCMAVNAVLPRTGRAHWSPQDMLLVISRVSTAFSYLRDQRGDHARDRRARWLLPCIRGAHAISDLMEHRHGLSGVKGHTSLAHCPHAMQRHLQQRSESLTVMSSDWHPPLCTPHCPDPGP